MALTAMSVFAPALGGDRTALGIVIAIFVAVNIPCIFTWVMLGVSVRSHLDKPRRRVAINIALAALLLYTVVAIWL